VQLVDTKAISRGMVKVEPGEDLVESLQALARVAGWQEAVVTGAGVLELAELASAGETITVENAELLSLAGRIERRDGQPLVVLRATLLTTDGSKSGRIVAAMTGGLTLVVDAIHEAGAATNTGRTLPAPSVSDRGMPSPSVTTNPLSGGTATLPAPGRKVSNSGLSKPPSQSFRSKPMVRPPTRNRFDLDEDDDENPVVNTGDFLAHPQLGLCEVVGYDESGGTKIRVPNGKVRVLKLDALIVEKGVEDDEGRDVFNILGPRKRR
jgi:predicted DNA-binding protein with PD1-like motif